MTNKDRNKELLEFNARDVVKNLLAESEGYLIAMTAYAPTERLAVGLEKCLESKYHVIALEVKNHKGIKVYMFDSTPESKRARIMATIEEKIDEIVDEFRIQREFNGLVEEILKMIF